MKSLLDILLEEIEYSKFKQEMILERNEKIFPTEEGAYEKLEILTGDHCKKRQKERNVSNREILDAVFGAYKEIRSAYKDGKIKISKNGKKSSFIITDARKNKRKPIAVVGFIHKMLGTKNKWDKYPKFKRPSIIIKTVYKGDDFTGSISNRKYSHKIFLY